MDDIETRLSQLTVNELRDIAKKIGVPSSGLKLKIIERISTHSVQNGLQSYHLSEKLSHLPTPKSRARGVPARPPASDPPWRRADDVTGSWACLSPYNRHSRHQDPQTSTEPYCSSPYSGSRVMSRGRKKGSRTRNATRKAPNRQRNHQRKLVEEFESDSDERGNSTSDECSSARGPSHTVIAARRHTNSVPPRKVPNRASTQEARVEEIRTFVNCATAAAVTARTHAAAAEASKAMPSVQTGFSLQSRNAGSYPLAYNGAPHAAVHARVIPLTMPPPNTAIAASQMPQQHPFLAPPAGNPASCPVGLQLLQLVQNPHHHSAAMRCLEQAGRIAAGTQEVEIVEILSNENGGIKSSRWGEVVLGRPTNANPQWNSCMCRGNPGPGDLADGDVTCSSCGRSSHRRCLKIPPTAYLSDFTCILCRFQKADPFLPVDEFLFIAPFSIHRTTARVKIDCRTNLQKWRKSNREVVLFGLNTLTTGLICEWPHSVEVMGNDNKVTVDPPQPDHKRRDLPIIVTSYIKPERNTFRISCNLAKDDADPSPLCYAFAILLARAETVKDLANRVVSQASLPFEECRRRVHEMVNEKTDDDELVCLNITRRAKLTCPLTLTRIEVPTRGKNCKHLQCYDLNNYLEVTKSTKAFNNRWKCPQCHLIVRPIELVVDGYFQRVLESAPRSAVAVEVQTDSTWVMLGEEDVKEFPKSEERDSSTNESPKCLKKEPGPSAMAREMRSMGGMDIQADKLIDIIDSSDEECATSDDREGFLSHASAASSAAMDEWNKDNFNLIPPPQELIEILSDTEEEFADVTVDEPGPPTVSTVGLPCAVEGIETDALVVQGTELFPCEQLAQTSPASRSPAEDHQLSSSVFSTPEEVEMPTDTTSQQRSVVNPFNVFDRAGTGRPTSGSDQSSADGDPSALVKCTEHTNPMDGDISRASPNEELPLPPVELDCPRRIVGSEGTPNHPPTQTVPVFRNSAARKRRDATVGSDSSGQAQSSADSPDASSKDTCCQESHSKSRTEGFGKKSTADSPPMSSVASDGWYSGSNPGGPKAKCRRLRQSSQLKYSGSNATSSISASSSGSSTPTQCRRRRAAPRDTASSSVGGLKSSVVLLSSTATQPASCVRDGADCSSASSTLGQTYRQRKGGGRRCPQLGKDPRSVRCVSSEQTTDSAALVT